MIRYRPFLNSDPPALAEIWRSRPPSRAIIQLMSAAVLDDMVFAKPYFDRQGLILAVEDDKPIGFVHAGFGANAELSDIDPTQGTTALLLVSPHRDRDVVANELLAHSERYLRQRGATTIRGGATMLLAPFYLGLCGGSQLPGVLASDVATADLFRKAGYEETTYARIFRCDLSSFRPPVDRELMQVRRQFQLAKQTESLPQSWWEAGQFATIERTEFVLNPKGKEDVAVVAKFWDIEPLASSWGVHAMGLVSKEVMAKSNEAALATYFFGEIFRQFQGLGIRFVEFQLQPHETWVIDVCRKLGCDEIDQGLLFRKPATS